MRKLLLALPILIAPSLALAEEEAAPEPEKTAPPAQSAAAVAPDQDRPFEIRRGLHFEADLGVFFTFGGRNTNDPNLQYPGKGISNVQPYLGVFAGYDLVHTNSYSLAAGLKLGAGYSGGAGRVPASEVMPGNPKTGERSNDFGILEVGVGGAFGYLVNDRLAITVKVDGGLAALDPDPLLYADDPAAGGSAFSGMVGGGLGVEYFTLLNDFSVGLDARFAGIFHGGFIPALSITVPVKYTF